MKLGFKNKNALAAIVAAVVTVIAGCVINYILLPAWNIHSIEIWVFAVSMLIVFFAVEVLLVGYMQDGSKVTFKKPVFSVPVILAVLLAFAAFVLNMAGSSFFNAKKYASIIADDITVMDWNETVENKENVTDIALMDTNTAAVFGNRTLGALSDIVSQYDVSDTYTQVNLSGKPMKIALLEYESFWKWVSNRDNGVPGYVMVDPVNSTAKYVKLDEAVKYSPSEYFRRDAFRTLRRNYPTDILGAPYFEVDEEGYPYYIAPVYKTTIGLFGGRVIDSAIIMDAVTGECEKFAAEDIPEWVDVVFDGDYLTERLDWWGCYSNGFWNSKFAKTGCKQTTKSGGIDEQAISDYGYITIGNDIWIYTGITSMAQDSSNIAVVMGNERTGEIHYFAVAGADENSAMAAAEGEVQQYGYHASFPSLINVNGEPTYIMVLCDDNYIVKEYAMVNMDNYSKVVVESSQTKVFAAYAEEMGFEVSKDIEEELNNEDGEDVVLKETEFVIADIQFIVNNGNTTVYITDAEGKFYKSAFDEFWIVAKAGDKVKAKYNEKYEGDKILYIQSFE